MIRKIVVCMLTCFVWFPSFAQEESISKQINQFKRDSSFLYSEATDETAEKALDAARITLMMQVQEYLQSNQKPNKVNEAVRQSIYAKTSSLEMMRGTLYRVFVYVKKSDINVLFEIQQQPLTQETKSLISPRASQTEMRATGLTNDNIAEKVKEGKVKEQPTSMPASEKVQAAEAAEMSNPKNEKQNSGQKKVTDLGLSEWQMAAIEDLLKCSDVNEVRAKLNRMKVEYRIKKFGIPDNCPSPDSTFWLIFSQDGSVNTILGPGTKERVSFRDMTTTELDKYKGMNAIWFNFAN